MFNIPTNIKQALNLNNLNASTGSRSPLSNLFGGGGQQNTMQQGGFNQQPMQQDGFNQQNNYQQSGFNQQPMQQDNYQFNQQPMQQNNYQQGGFQQQNNFQQPQMNQGQALPGSGGRGVILKKGQKTSLTGLNPNLDLIDVCLGWDVSGNGQYDLDTECFMLGANEKVLGDDWFVFYNQPVSPDGTVRHSGDNKTGAGDGDDEIMHIQLSKMSPQVSKLVFIVTINEAKELGLNFSGVKNAYIRVVDKGTNQEMIRFNLTDYYATVTSMMVGELYRYNNEWKFTPIGDGTQDDLFGLCTRYGVNIAG